MKNIHLILILSLLTACGGGGGGGGGNEPDSSRTGARVLNGAIESAPVDLVSALQGVIKTASFADDTGFVELNSGTQILNLYRTKDLTSPLLTRQVINEENQKQTVIFYGDRDNFGFRANLISEEFPEVPDGVSQVRIIHAAVGASSVEANLGAGTVVAGFGSVSPYANVTPGPITVNVKRVVDKTSVDNVAFTTTAGKAYTVFVAGEVGYFVVSRVLEEN